MVTLPTNNGFGALLSVDVVLVVKFLKNENDEASFDTAGADTDGLRSLVVAALVVITFEENEASGLRMGS